MKYLRNDLTNTYRSIRRKLQTLLNEFKEELKDGEKYFMFMDRKT